MGKSILIEGYTVKQLLSLSDAEIDAWILVNDPIIFRVGTAEILGKVEAIGSSLIIELAQIDGGGEGILRTIGILARKYARKQNLQSIDWIVHSLDCIDPNPKLNPMLERASFTIQHIPQKANAYFRRMPV